MTREFDRAGRVEQVKTLLKSENRMLTSHELARKMGVKPSWYWRSLFLEMYHARLIAGCSVKLKNKKTAYYWGDASKTPEYVTAELQPCS